MIVKKTWIANLHSLFILAIPIWFLYIFLSKVDIINNFIELLILFILLIPPVGILIVVLLLLYRVSGIRYIIYENDILTFKKYFGYEEIQIQDITNLMIKFENIYTNKIICISYGEKNLYLLAWHYDKKIKELISIIQSSIKTNNDKQE